MDRTQLATTGWDHAKAGVSKMKAPSLPTAEPVKAPTDITPGKDENALPAKSLAETLQKAVQEEVEARVRQPERQPESELAPSAAQEGPGTNAEGAHAGVEHKGEDSQDPAIVSEGKITLEPSGNNSATPVVAMVEALSEEPAPVAQSTNDSAAPEETVAPLAGASEVSGVNADPVVKSEDTPDDAEKGASETPPAPAPPVAEGRPMEVESMQAPAEAEGDLVGDYGQSHPDDRDSYPSRT